MDGKNLRIENFLPIINKIDPEKQKRILDGIMPAKIKEERQSLNVRPYLVIKLNIATCS